MSYVRLALVRYMGVIPLFSSFDKVKVMVRVRVRVRVPMCLDQGLQKGHNMPVTSLRKSYVGLLPHILLSMNHILIAEKQLFESIC